MPAPSPAGLALTWTGVGGWVLADGHARVVVDPFYSRPYDGQAHPAQVAARTPPSATVVLVGHAHVDHALDAPAVAKQTGAPLFGPPGLEGATRTMTGGEREAVGAVTVQAVQSHHSLIGKENGDDITTLAWLVTLGGHRVLVFDTANFVEEALAGLTPDIAVIATGLRQKVPDYECRLMRALGNPRYVLATHFDEWKGPAAQRLSADTQADLEAFRHAITSCSPGTTVVIPTDGVAWTVP